MSLIKRALDSPGLVEYFSYLHYGQIMRKKIRAISSLRLKHRMRLINAGMKVIYHEEHDKC